MKRLILMAMVAIAFASCGDSGNTEAGAAADTSMTGVGTNEATGSSGTPGDTTGYGRDTTLTGTGTSGSYDSVPGSKTGTVSGKDSLNSNSGTRRKPGSQDTSKRQ